MASMAICISLVIVVLYITEETYFDRLSIFFKFEIPSVDIRKSTTRNGIVAVPSNLIGEISARSVCDKKIERWVCVRLA